MYIDIFKNNGTEYIRLRESYRTKTAEGKVAIRKRTICNIGPLSKFDDGEPNYLERLRESRLCHLIVQKDRKKFIKTAKNR